MHREMSNQPDKRFLIVVLVFGVVGTLAGVRWLSSGSIVIREGKTQVGVAAGARPPAARGNSPVAGIIQREDLLYYPLCIAWIGLGTSMITLPALWLCCRNEVYARLSAYSCLAILLLGFATVAAALWSGK
jgi:hypothetical protein